MADAAYKHIIVALPCEARPFIDYYRLHGVLDFPGFRCYVGDDVRLLVTGVGKVAAAAAVGACQGYFRNAPHQVWLNVGVAGHRELSLGSTVLAGKITDQATQRSWYPPLLCNVDLPVQEVCTVDVPETAYRDAMVYEMEASGFYATATHFATAELVQCIKVISDNSEQGVSGVHAAQVQALLAAQVPVIDALLARLTRMSREVAPDGELRALMQTFVERHRITAYQRRELEKSLRHFLALGGDGNKLAAAVTAGGGGAKPLSWLQAQIAALPYDLLAP